MLNFFALDMLFTLLIEGIFLMIPAIPYSMPNDIGVIYLLRCPFVMTPMVSNMAAVLLQLEVYQNSLVRFVLNSCLKCPIYIYKI